jgi:dihydrodipicolinate synthase/N-acetylneuraminate lyase
MAIDHDFPTNRSALLRLLFPDGVPQLWVPTLVFYDEAGGIDRERQLAHLAFMAPYVKGYLVPGSTGDGWDMTDVEAIAALESVIPFAMQHGLDLIVGILRPTPDSALALIENVLNHLRSRAGTRSLVDAFAATRVRGLTISAPTSDPPLSQAAIASALTPIFRLGLPIALYQLPQVTGNTMTPELVADLAEEFPNLILFKDSSGTDEVALSGKMPSDIALLRGAEGRYAQWSKAHGGPYDGFLLSSGNSFPGQLAGILDDLRSGRVAEAERSSAVVSAAIADAFAAVIEVRQGNAFTNANKALSQLMAFGDQALNVPPPRLYGGGHLPRSVLEAVQSSLARHGLSPAHGYFEHRFRSLP